MSPEEAEALLADVEQQLQADVQVLLDEVSAAFLDDVDTATELVAAAFSVSSIRAMWRARVPRLMTRLRAIAHRSAAATAADLGEPEPTDSELDAVLDPYQEATRPLIEAVGDHLAEAASQSLAEGVNAGEDLNQLKARMHEVFGPTGAQLGPVRAARISQTEANRAYNAGVQAAAESITGPDRPLVKQWLTRRDVRVREAHAEADGQIRLLGELFDVGGSEMMYPGDPTAPADLTINCRCLMAATAPPRNEGNDMAASDDAGELASRMPAPLKRYWLLGPGAAKIGWGTPGSFERCVRALRDDFPQDTEGLCANLYKDATGRWPGQRAEGETVHTGAMVALMPRTEDAARLALADGEAADQLHVTLFYLGEGADWPEDAQAEVIDGVSRAAEWLGPVTAKAFGAAHWNPAGESPVWVWNIGDDIEAENARTQLKHVYDEIRWALEERHGESPDVPAQHSPWAPHVAAVYTPENRAGDLAERCGPVVFDRIRVAFAGQYTDIPLGYLDGDEPDQQDPAFLEPAPVTAPWSTPAPMALAFENQQTGDGRVFAPGALYWDGNGPWPLMANEHFDSHDDAELAGAITELGRDGDRITGSGSLYLRREAGSDAAMLLAQGAPLGVSVDLDDVDIEMVDTSENGAGAEAYRARLLRASVMPSPNGGFYLKGEMVSSMTASATATVTETVHVLLTVGPDGLVPRAAFEIEAAAGDRGDVGTVLDTMRTGDYLMRITRGRIRGATLVTVPAFANAGIALDDQAQVQSMYGLTAAGWNGKPQTDTSSDYDRVLRHVRRSKAPAGAARIAQFLKIPIRAVQRHLATAASRGEVVRLTRGLYTDSTTSAKADHVMMDDMLASGELVASVTGSVDLPVAGRDMAWDGAAATDRVFEWADGEPDQIEKAFAYRDDEADPTTKAAYKLGYADVIDGRLTIVPRGVFAAQAAVEGARGGVDIPADELSAVRDHLAAVRAHVDEVTGGDNMEQMQASAWDAMADLPPMPAEWFREPTPEELPPGGPGVNYVGGRIFGWVAQADVPHVGYSKRIVINDLGKIDTSNFLRQRKTLDDGSTVKVGAFTMNAGHNRDGAECETAACQFDDTRTVAGIITVGMNERGMWFSGAAAPWLSEWDRQVFHACQPSYHLKQGPGGRWNLHAVLSVPVPGHPSALLASAVAERSQLALTAAATVAAVDAAVKAEEARQAAERQDVQPVTVPEIVAAVLDALDAREARKAAEAAELELLLAEARTMADDITEGA